MLRTGLALVVLGAMIIVVLVVAIGGPTSHFQYVASGGVKAQALMRAALLLQSKISGSRANTYDQSDPFMQQMVIPYWKQSCQNPDGTLCDLAKPGNLNCVEFVTAVFALTSDPLPVHPDAETFWTTYQHRAGWLEIPSPSSFPGSARVAPQLGDMMVWKGGRHTEQQADGRIVPVEYGHIAIIVSFFPPSVGEDGFLEVAQANAPGNKWGPGATDRPGNTYTMVMHPDYTISTWGSGLDTKTSPPTMYGAYSVLGFIRQVTSS